MRTHVSASAKRVLRTMCTYRYPSVQKCVYACAFRIFVVGVAVVFFMGVGSVRERLFFIHPEKPSSLLKCYTTTLTLFLTWFLMFFPSSRISYVILVNFYSRTAVSDLKKKNMHIFQLFFV